MNSQHQPNLPTKTRRAAVTIVAIAMVLALGSCSGHKSESEAVVIVDRTGVADASSWSSEVSGEAQSMLTQAVGDGVNHVDLIGIGSNTNQTAKAASVDLTKVSGNTGSKRNTARQQLIGQVASVSSQLASQPVTTTGTDVVAAFQEAASLCHPAETCQILVLSDMEDQRVTEAPTVAAAVKAVEPLMPNLHNITVTVSGLGSSGSNQAVVDRVTRVWTTVLAHAGAINVQLARSY